MDEEGVADELGNDRAGTGPSRDRLFDAGGVLLVHLGKQLWVDKGTLFE